MTAPPPASPAFLVMALGRRVRSDVEHELAAHGLSLRLVSALGHLAREPGASYSELARRAGITAQSMQATVARLERDGAVERRTDSGRGRTAELHVTDAGTAALDRARQVMADADRRLLDAVPPDQREALTAALSRALRAGEQVSSP